jgi:hypothetical protein
MLAAFIGVMGKRDVTPAAVNWGNLSGISPQSNANQTISGINQPITLHFDVTITSGAGTLSYDINDGSAVPFVDNDTVSVSNGQTVSFRASDSSGAFEGSVSVKNASDGMVELDSFTFSVFTV